MYRYSRRGSNYNELEAMNLDVILVDNAGGDEEERDVLALVALELDDFPQLLVVDNVSIAAEVFLNIFKDLVVAELIAQPLHRRQALLPIPLLYAHVHILLPTPAPRFLRRLCQWIECTWDYFQINHQTFCRERERE